ncbi:hypothetical protein C5167_022150 [Papaver somniferum]|uniref:Uncharacterized protein n=1 Tax=Papaver somniferum TaxID=3469 RepID=A0A4Y7JK45_PAPSO|nr:hypothetical protein C5167_022150 [Papaver somniferum]
MYTHSLYNAFDFAIKSVFEKLRHSLSAVQDLVKEIKPIGLSERTKTYLRKAPYENEQTPATFDGSLVSTFDDSFTSTQPTQFDESLVVTATTQEGDNPEPYRLMQIGPNDDMTDVEITTILDEVVSNINESEYGAALMENAEPSSTAPNQQNFDNDQMMENAESSSTDLKLYERNPKKIKKNTNEETMDAFREEEVETMVAVPEVEEERMVEVAEEDDGTMRKDMKGSEVIERLDGEKKKKVFEYFNTHPKTDFKKFWIPKLVKDYYKCNNSAVRLFAPMCNNNTHYTLLEYDFRSSNPWSHMNSSDIKKLRDEHYMQAKKYAFAITTETKPPISSWVE